MHIQKTLLALFAFGALTANAGDVAPIYQALIGKWTGLLEYRDFRSDKMVQLPTWLEVKPSADPGSIDLAYTYDDGPGKVVTEVSRVTIDFQQHLFAVTSDRDQSKDLFEISGGDEIARNGRGTLHLTGPGTENGTKVDVRITIEVGRNLYSYRKETRRPGEEFVFRDGYTFTRRDPPSRLAPSAVARPAH